MIYFYYKIKNKNYTEKEIYEIEKNITYDDFLEFLNLTTKFDVLLVEDSQKGNFKINPYLPSKISDYKGSGSSIWGVCESESVMDNLDIDYKSKLNNIDSGKTAIENMTGLTVTDVNIRIAGVNMSAGKHWYRKPDGRTDEQKRAERTDFYAAVSGRV